MQDQVQPLFLKILNNLYKVLIYLLFLEFCRVHHEFYANFKIGDEFLNLNNKNLAIKIDVEGHEMNILESYSWDIKPDFITMEHSHIDDLYAAAFLKEKGYLVYTEQSDLYAIR